MNSKQAFEMMQKRTNTTIKAILCLISCPVLGLMVSADDWPQYLGPNRNSTSEEKGILRTWPEDGPKELWSANVGKGFGGPVVKDGKVYLLDRDDEVGETLRCMNLSDGKELWTFAYDAPGSAMFPGSRGVPTVDDKYIYSCGHNGDLYCLDLNTHQPVWNVNVWTDFGGKPASPGGGGFRSRDASSFPIWAITQNPLIYNDLVIVAPQAPEAGVVAYDKTTGELKWKTPNLGNESYASPVVIKIEGNDHIVMVISSTNPIGNRGQPQTLGHVVGIEPTTGKVLWDYDKWNCHISVPSALDVGNNKILVVGGYELGATMIQVEQSTNGSYSVKELFTTEDFGDQTKPPVLHKGHVYAQFGTNRTRDGLVCMDLDGNIKWKTGRDPDFNKGSMILVDGVLLATDGSTMLYVIEPNPSGFKALAKAKVLSEGGTGAEGIAARVGGSTQNWAPLALSNGRLLVRDQGTLKCLQVSK